MYCCEGGCDVSRWYSSTILPFVIWYFRNTLKTLGRWKWYTSGTHSVCLVSLVWVVPHEQNTNLSCLDTLHYQKMNHAMRCVLKEGHLWPAIHIHFDLTKYSHRSQIHFHDRVSRSRLAHTGHTRNGKITSPSRTKTRSKADRQSKDYSKSNSCHETIDA